MEKSSHLHGGCCSKNKAWHTMAALAVLFLFLIARISSVGGSRLLGEGFGPAGVLDATKWKFKGSFGNGHGRECQYSSAGCIPEGGLDPLYGMDKRSVPTGPNPLHN